MEKISKAIAVYLDDSDKMETEFSWLYKTWIYHDLNREFDLVVYHNPSAEHRLDKFYGIIKVPMPCIRKAQQYKFLNSHYFCTPEWSEPLKKYDYLLKTDCDVFLTHNLQGYEPSKLLVGQGGYCDVLCEKQNAFFQDFSKLLDLEYKNIKQVGASFYGKTTDVLPLVANQALITEFIIKDAKLLEKYNLHPGISSMLAGELVLNNFLTSQHIVLWAIDSKCWETIKIGSDVLHIHAWHTNQRWSKHQFFEGKYDDWVVSESEMYENAANYCNYFSNLTLEQLFLKKLNG